MTDRDAEIRLRLSRLTAEFPRYLEAFDMARPFSKEGQLSFHVETIARRRELESATQAIGDERFLALLYGTLRAWGIGVRGSVLRPFDHFKRSLQAKAEQINALDGPMIDSESLLGGGIQTRLWSLIADLDVVDNKAVIVAGTKTLHHVLPELVIPFDRMYTGAFFKRQAPQFQQGQDQLFKLIFRQLHQVAVEVQPEQYVSTGWRSSRTKVVDNALVGFCLVEGVV